MHAEPFTCYRPAPEAAEKFASLPYDVYDRAEAATYAAGHPSSFLAIDRPETTFEPEHDMYADDVYQKAHDLLFERVADGTLTRDGKPCYYLYRLRQNGHEQTGIVCACALDDYNNGVIRKHELTRPEKEEDRVRHIEATGCQTGPIFLAYRNQRALEALVEAAKGAEPLYDFYAAHNVRQTVWRVSHPAAVETFRALLEHVPSAYIADGHHRAASAARVCRAMRAQAKGSCKGSEPYNYLLCVLFPSDQLRIMPYNRVVLDTNGLDEKGLMGALEGAGFKVGGRREAPVTPRERGRFGMWAFGAWRELALTAARPNDLVAALDVSVLQDRVLGPVLGIIDPVRDARIRFVGGVEGPEALTEHAGASGVAFSLNATSMRELMDVADAGRLMPPKSTWFEPKLLSGLFIRKISQGWKND